MATQIGHAKEGDITREMEKVVANEGISIDVLRENIASGKTIIPANRNHKSLVPIAIGKGVTVKINANIGASRVRADINEELRKIELCEKYGADTAMDLSTGGDLDRIRKAIIEKAKMPIGTVPIYQVVEENNGDIASIKKEAFLEVMERQAKQGVDFMTVHGGLLRKVFPLLRARYTGIVSRGGAILYEWMKANNAENPLYTQFDQIIEIFERHDVAFSLGDGLRPGCLHDATDDAQISELKVLGELTKRAWDGNCQVMIEGPGHVPMDQIKLNVELQKKYCHGAPFYVLGPLVTDIAAGYDHISSAIGAAMAAYYGADYLCYVTPREHLGLPNEDDVRQGIIAYKIAAHAADIAHGLPNARKRDDEMAKARFNFDWEKQFELSLDGETAKSMRSDLKLNTKFCSMCGPDFCPMRIYGECGKETN